jgi:triosephosphate isomerase
MHQMRTKIAAGNWKMNGVSHSLDQLNELVKSQGSAECVVVICPPSPLLFPAVEMTHSSSIDIGAQDCHTAQSGAHTGDISAPMVKDTGAKYVIVGHSERRETYGETDEDVCAKAIAARDANLIAILCIGESLSNRETGKTLDVIGAQLAASVPEGATADTLVIAYEPIWAIGTGKVPTLAQIIEVHDFIRAELDTRFGAEIGNGISLLYGGSVKASNAAEIFTAENVDGALVGGASLKAADFSPIVDALSAS